jgi:MSHA pilin protein MshD
MTRNGTRLAGFTLIEMVATIVILSIALVGVAGMVSLGTSNSANTLLETRAIALGQAYLDEIMGRRFDERSDPGGLDPCYGFVGGDRCTDIDDFGTEGAEATRDRFDDVDDYHDLAEGDGEPDPIVDADGDTRAEYENFHVQVTVCYSGGNGPCLAPPLADTATNGKLITVAVRNRAEDVGWKFSVYKANF